MTTTAAPVGFGELSTGSIAELGSRAAEIFPTPGGHEIKMQVAEGGLAVSTRTSCWASPRRTT